MPKPRLLLSMICVCLLPGCAKPPPVFQPPAQYEQLGAVAAFDSADWRVVLSKVVTPGGYVRWSLLAKEQKLRDALMRYVSLIGRASPANRPDLFQTKADQLAYWINAYNAVCMYGVLLRNQTNPPALYTTDHFLFGGQPLTLDQVEEQKIKPLNDPRAAFAVNHCTYSSPPLRNEPYDPLKLGAQLVDQGKVFLGDSRGVVSVDEDTVKVSTILMSSYASQFLAAYQRKYSKTGTILQALQPYAVKHSALWDATAIMPLEYNDALNRP